MMEGSVMEMGKLYITLFIIFTLFSLAMFFASINHANEYKQYVNYQIERYGGLNGTALTKIDEYNNDHYDGKFQVESAQMNQKFPYGEQVTYTIKTNYEFFFLPILSRDIQVKGAALSNIR
jgi:hypothetical protein